MSLPSVNVTLYFHYINISLGFVVVEVYILEPSSRFTQRPKIGSFHRCLPLFVVFIIPTIFSYFSCKVRGGSFFSPARPHVRRCSEAPFQTLRRISAGWSRLPWRGFRSVHVDVVCISVSKHESSVPGSPSSLLPVFLSSPRSRLDALCSAALPARLDSRPRAGSLSSSPRFRSSRTKVLLQPQSFAAER